MNLNHLQLLGLAMVVFAFGGQIFIPGAVVYYSTGTPGMLYWPSGTTPNAPQAITAQSGILVHAMFTGVQLSEVSSVSCQISSWTGSAWTTLGTYALAYDAALSAQMGVLDYNYRYQFGAPGILYSLSYSGVTTDAGSFTGIGYVKTASLNGYFLINGIRADTATILRVTSPTLTLAYTITTSGIYATDVSVYVNVLNGTIQLQKVELVLQSNQALQNLTAPYTLPGPGTYTLNGFVTYAGSTTQQMSIITPWDIGSASTMSFSSFYMVIGLFGVGFIFLGSRKKKTA